MSTDVTGRRTRRRRVAAVAALLAAAVAAPVEAATPRLEVAVADAALSVGDRLPVRVVARGDDDLVWGALTVATAADGDWAVVDGPREVGGARPPAWEVTLAPLAVGRLELPPLRAVVRHGADGEPVDVAAEPVPTVEVVSVLPPAAAEAEPAPMAEPVGVRGFPWEWLAPAAVVLVPLAIGLWWLVRRSRPAAAGDDVRTALPPLPELERLVAELDGRIGRDPAAAVCDRLARGLRRYLERRTGEPAAEMTSFELRLLGRRLGWPDPVRRAVQRVTALADGVRFGRLPAPDDELRSGLAAAVEAARGLERHLAPPAAAEAAR